MLSIQVQKTLSSPSSRFVLEVELHSQQPRVVLLGPSGSGKTLLMQMLAGLVRPDRGQIHLGAQCWYDHAQRRHWSPAQRRVGYLPQDYALFPHLTVRQNLSFAQQRGWRNPRRNHAPAAVAEWLARMQLQSQADLYPAQLSGGQRQRTALARALLSQPQLLLLDEPFAALDVPLRARMREELLTLQTELAIPMILISHDPADAELLAQTVWTLGD